MQLRQKQKPPWHSDTQFPTKFTLGICHNESLEHPHQHIFCECPVVRAMLLKLGVPPVETLGEWVYGEEPLCRRTTKPTNLEQIKRDNKERKIRGNFYRELASAIWNLERKLRATGEDASQVEIQTKYLSRFKRAQSSFLKVKKFVGPESSQSQATGSGALWLSEVGQGGGSPAGTE